MFLCLIAIYALKESHADHACDLAASSDTAEARTAFLNESGGEAGGGDLARGALREEGPLGEEAAVPGRHRLEGSLASPRDRLPQAAGAAAGAGADAGARNLLVALFTNPITYIVLLVISVLLFFLGLFAFNKCCGSLPLQRCRSVCQPY